MSQGKAALATVSVALVVMTGTLEAQSLPLIAPNPTDFFTLEPCRVIDTRAPAGPRGGPALVAGADRVFPVAGTCGISAFAKAISVNIAVTAATAPGNLRLHPGGSAVPLISSINYSAGQTRSNNMVVSPNDLGELAAFVGAASGTVHLVLDVNGYFARAAYRTFAAGSLIIPMDLAYQNSGMLQAYGLLFQLLRQGITVYWTIDPNKTWHAAPCNTPGDLCAWDCAIQGSGVKCPYPTASPDFFVASQVRWDDTGLPPGAAIANHGYRGGPFVIDAANRNAALTIINAWNDPALWAGAPWAVRTIFRVVSVHEATAGFVGPVRKEMVVAPSIAVIADGNEDIATGYLRAAGIPQSNGSEFPTARCAVVNCGPGTENPDLLPLPSIMGDMGTCNAMNYDHRNGSLFTPEGLPAYCQVVSAHWNVADRETVQCNGAACPATQAQCTGQTVTYHGHEAVAELREFLKFPVHFFAECQAALAYENTTPNPGWPYLDDAARDGHFLTTQGTPPTCSGPCVDSEFQCVVGGCGGGTVDCCLATDVKERGAGLMIAPQPSSSTLQVLQPEVAYNQLDGPFQTVGGSDPAYKLSAFLGTTYKNDRQVTFITGPNQPGEQDVWMTGFLDGACNLSAGCNRGKVSYLGGHQYDTATPISGSADSQGTRLFLNGLFEAGCPF